MSWDPLDQAKVDVYLSEQAQFCSRCGTYTWEWEYQDEDGDWHEHKHPDRKADLWTCIGCREIERTLEPVVARPPVPHGMQVRWFPTERIQKLIDAVRE